MVAPDWLSKEAKKEFHKLAKTVVVTDQNLFFVATLAQNICLYKQVSSHLNSGQLFFEHSGKPNPLIAVQQKYYTQIANGYKQLFGGQQDQTPVDNPLDKIRDKNEN